MAGARDYYKGNEGRTFVSHVAPFPTWLGKMQVDDYAAKVASILEFDVGAPLEPIVSRLGGEISYNAPEEHAEKSGAIVARAPEDFTIYLASFTSPIRDRFTIAHELGHLFLHLPMVKKRDPDATMIATRWVDETNQDQQRAEWEANWFAAGFLMPAEEFLEYKDHDVEYIASRFNVSVQAAQIRLKLLGQR
jgi:predicted transcriptional regulator